MDLPLPESVPRLHMDLQLSAFWLVSPCVSPLPLSSPELQLLCFGPPPLPSSLQCPL